VHRASALRAELAQRGLDGFVVLFDQHMGEYLPAVPSAWLADRLCGSAGAAMMPKDKA
jgi:hypothetical protein